MNRRQCFRELRATADRYYIRTLARLSLKVLPEDVDNAEFNVWSHWARILQDMDRRLYLKQYGHQLTGDWELPPEDFLKKNSVEVTYYDRPYKHPLYDGEAEAFEAYKNSRRQGHSFIADAAQAERAASRHLKPRVNVIGAQQAGLWFGQEYR